jgi:hypothetical protein
VSRSQDTLVDTLQRIRSGDVRPGDLEAARALIALEPRVPDDVRAGLFESAHELPADAAGVLALLGLDDLGAVLADGIRAEADAVFEQAEVAGDSWQVDGWQQVADALVDGLREAAAHVDLADAVVRRLPVAAFAHGGLVGAAVSREAGEVEVADHVARDLSLGGAVGAELAGAVAALGGQVDVAGAVMSELAGAGLGEVTVPVADAVRAEAGPVDVVPAVLAALGLWRAEAPLVAPAAAASAASAASAPVLAPAANSSRSWGFAGFALAAAVLVSVVVGRLAVPVEGSVPVPGPAFAHAGEVVIEDLQYGSDVQVIQTEGDDGAVILWIDEEA